MKDLTLIFLFVLALSQCASAQNIDSLISEAKTNVDKDAYQEAFSLYEKCFEMDETALECLLGAAKSAHKSGDLGNAKKYYVQYVEEDSLNQTALNAIASIFDQEQNSAKAIKYYNQLNQLNPGNAVYFRKHANQYKRGGMFNDAQRLYEKAYRLNQRDILTVKSLAEIRITLGEYAEADSLLHLAFDLDSTDVGLQLLSAKNYYRLKDYSATVRMLVKANISTGLDNYNMKMLGYSFMQIDSLDRAIFWLTQSLVNETNPEYAHYYLGNAYHKKEEVEYAKMHYEKAIEAGISKNMGKYHVSLAKIYEEEKNLSKAIKQYEKAYAYTKNPLYLYQLALAADLYYADKTIAVRYYEKYMKSGHDNSAYLKYSFERSGYLREIAHLRKGK